ncbi:unnamed protein product [Adineta ricciae]|uniref:GPI ethanolamine phosphate transferase 1 n=1 Tax=Adineta ricciae TaxID=249248 RepID=A0A816AQY9_ADIRI|nr:unnamed protein product [Adineta ricciae]
MTKGNEPKNNSTSRMQYDGSTIMLLALMNNTDWRRRPSAIESMILDRYKKQRHTLYVTFLLFFMLFVYGMSERHAITSGSDPNLNIDFLNALNDRNTTQTYFGAQSLNLNDKIRTRVVYFILDGLRFDAIQTNPSLKALLTSTWFASDSLLLKMSTQFPTVSVPNWQSLITGARPSLHGRVGNDDLTPYTFDSIFTSVMSVGMKNGLSGDGWWSILLNGHLTPFYGDGTSPTLTHNFGDAFYTHGHSDRNKDIAYNQRFHAAINSQTVVRRSNGSMDIIQFDYDLFLSYYGDIDGESHSFGPQSSQTQSAIDDKVMFVREGINAITTLDAMTQTRTVFIITSDHGHVNAGGHGGDAHVLMTVPLIVYVKDSQLASAKNLLPVYSTFDTVDIATTIAGLLGAPVPRQSEGTFISPLISALVPASKWHHLYFDLFKQKQSLVKALLKQWNQSSLESQYHSLLADAMEKNINITVLNNNINALSTLIEVSKTHRITHIMMRNFLFGLVIGIFGILALCIVFHRSTFLNFYALLPLRGLLLNRRFTKNMAEDKSVSTYVQRVHRTFFIFALVIIGLWWLLMMILLLVIFANIYRPTDEWRWQLTLFNSAHDAYVLIVGICVFGSFLVTVLIALTVWLVFSLKNMTIWLSSKQVTKSLVLSPTASLYYLSLYVTFLFTMNAILFHLSQSFHCLWLPFIRRVTIITPMTLNLRFQALTISFMMMPPMLSLMAINILIRNHLFRQFPIPQFHEHKECQTTRFHILANQCEHDE